MVNLVVLSQPRTGSTMFCSLLNSAPGVRILIEPINPHGHSHHMQPIDNKLFPQGMIKNNLNLALQILFDKKIPDHYELSGKKADKMSGFKIMAHQIRALPDQNIFWNYLSEHDVKVVLVFRYNILQQIVSDKIVF